MPELHLQLNGDRLETRFGEYTSCIPWSDVASLRLTRQNAHTYGRDLFEYITQNGDVRNALKNLPRNTRLLLMIEQPEVAAIPWEYMRLSNGILLAARHNFLRGLPPSSQCDSVLPVSPVSIVAVPVSPVDERRVLNVEGEWSNMVNMVKGREKALTLTRVRPPTLGTMRSEVDREGTVIVQFMGHSNSGVLLFEDDFAASKPVTETQFVEALDGKPYLVILNSCFSAVTALPESKKSLGVENSYLGNIARAVVLNGIPYALGMQFALYDYVALKITDFFYDFLLKPNSVEEAVRKTRARLEEMTLPFEPQDGEKMPTPQWLAGVPILYTSQRDPAPALSLSSGQPTLEPDPDRMTQIGRVLTIPEHFMGRGPEIQKALRLFNMLESKGGFIVLHGFGGIGKTSLAPAIAERISWRYRDRVFYYSFETFTRFDHAGLERINTEFAASFVNALATFYSIKPDEFPDERSLHNAIIARRKSSRSLLVLDNMETLIHAQNRKEAEALHLASFVSRLKEDRNIVLLTSREMPPSDWGESKEIHLSGLSDYDGARLFLSSLADDRRSAAASADCLELSRYVKGHPLCIRLLAGQFSDEHAKNLHDFLKDVQQELAQARQKTPTGEDPQRQANLSECLEYSLRRLTDEQKKVLHTVGLFQAPFLWEWADYVCDDKEQTTKYLQDLKRLGLLEVSRRNFEEGYIDLYEMHPMLRSHIKELIAALDTQTRERYALVFVGLMRQAWDTTKGMGYDQNAITRYLVLQSLTDCEAALQEETLSPTTRSLLAYHLAHLYERRGQIQRTLELYKQSLKIIQEPRDKKEVASTQSAIARVLRQQGKIADALSLYYQTLKTQEELGDRREAAITQAAIADVLVQQGKIADALSLYQQTLKIQEELGDRREVAVTQNGIANVLVQQGKIADALSLYQQSLEVYEELGDTRSLAVTQNDMAYILVQQGKIADALSLYQQALQTTEEFGDIRGVAVIQNAMANLLVDQGRVQEAMQLYQQSLKIKHELGDVGGVAITQNGIANILRQQGKIADALSLYQQALKIQEEIGDIRGMSITQGAIANVLRQQDEIVKALSLYQQALKIQEEIGDIRSIALTRSAISQLRWIQGEYKQALEILWKNYSSLSTVNFPLEIQGMSSILISMKKNFLGDEQAFDTLWLQATSTPQPDWLRDVQASSAHKPGEQLDEATRTILEAIGAFVNAPDWDASQRVVEEQKQVLFQDEAEAIFEQIIVQTNADGQQQVVEMLETHLGILRACKAEGIAETFERVKSLQTGEDHEEDEDIIPSSDLNKKTRPLSLSPDNGQYYLCSCGYEDNRSGVRFCPACGKQREEVEANEEGRESR